MEHQNIKVMIVNFNEIICVIFIDLVNLIKSIAFNRKLLESIFE